MNILRRLCTSWQPHTLLFTVMRTHTHNHKNSEEWRHLRSCDGRRSDKRESETWFMDKSELIGFVIKYPAGNEIIDHCGCGFNAEMLRAFNCLNVELKCWQRRVWMNACSCFRRKPQLRVSAFNVKVSFVIDPATLASPAALRVE